MSRIGVFVCHCGHNIAGTVDVEAVAEALRQHPGVALTTTYKYCCSDPGQKLIRDSVEEQGLDGVVVAACSPAMHEATFRRAVQSVGLNPYLCECANIREQCSWVHRDDIGQATSKAIDIVRSMVEKVKGDEPLVDLHLPITKQALVIGGGIAGMQAALDVADSGHAVVLVERRSQLGGRMAELSGTYLNFDTSGDVLQDKIDAVCSHPLIQVLTDTELLELSGYIGNFSAHLQTSGSGDGNQAPKSHHVEIGAIVIATGFDTFPLAALTHLGSGQQQNVVDTLTFEAMLAQEGQLKRTSDGKVPQDIVFVQCAGSRDADRGVPYCSKVCCMVVAKQAIMFTQRVPYGQAYVFHTDIRTAGRGYEEYLDRAMQDHRVLYVRAEVSDVKALGDKVLVWGEDTLTGQSVEVAADLVVLATAHVPSSGTAELAQRLRAATGSDGFFAEAHPKLRPVESLTAGLYLAGAAQWPKDIPETIAQASGAAAKVLSLFSRDQMTQEPTVAYVAEELCSGCGACVEVCPYDARQIHPVRSVASVNAALCQNCGACVVACPNKASQIHNWRPEQILAMLEAAL